MSPPVGAPFFSSIGEAPAYVVLLRGRILYASKPAVRAGLPASILTVYRDRLVIEAILRADALSLLAFGIATLSTARVSYFLISMLTTAAAEQPTGTDTAFVHLVGVTKRFGETIAVRDVTLAIKPGEFFALLGPSGCGKTTLLRTLAGFETPDGGRIHMAGRDVTDLPPQARPTAMVFQNYALFPTMTVGQNVGYGLSIQRVGKAEINRRVQEALDRVGLGRLVGRPVTQLSGGQQQRVALARSLAVEPDVLLFDEPLSNLDVALREQTRAELKTLQQTLGTTSLYVTHDQEEALALSDRLAVMRAGEIVEVGTPEHLYADPQTEFVARFLGGSNIVPPGALAEQLSGVVVPSGQVLAVRPEHLAPVEEGGVEVKVQARHFLGPVAEWTLEADGQVFRATLDPATSFKDTLRIRAVRWRHVTADQADVARDAA